MPQISINNVAGDKVGDLALAEPIFGAEVRADLVHTAVVAQLAAKRLGCHQTKSRGDVSGGGKKPYRQTGTGRARQGSTRAPQWVKGGHTFALRPRDYSQKLPRKLRRKALCAAWSDHVAEESLVVVDSFGLSEPKTRLAAAVLRALLAPVAERVAADVEPPVVDESDPRPARRKKVLQHALVMIGDETLRPAFRNLYEIAFDLADKVTIVYRIQYATAPYASVYDLALADVVVASQLAIEKVTAEFGGEQEASA